MIEITNIKIQDFYAIGDIDLQISNGIFKVTGVNLDVGSDEDANNGVSKSSLLVAVQQCFFNKNLKNDKAKIQETYNFATGKPYKITVNFNKGSDKYIVVNDRGTNTISITENDSDISPKGVPAQLRKVESILGVDFSAFSALTFLSQSTVSSVFDLTNSNNVLYRFFDIDKLKSMEKSLKSQLKYNKEEKTVHIINIKAIDKSLDLLNNYKKVNTAALINQKTILQEQLLNSQGSKEASKVKVLLGKISTQSTKFNTIKISWKSLETNLDLMRELAEELSSGICPTCNQPSTTVSTSFYTKIETMQVDYDALHEELKLIKDEISSLTQVKNGLADTLESKQREISVSINKIDSKLLVVREQEKHHKQIASDSTKLSDDKAVHIQSAQAIGKRITFIESALSVIKSGAITKEYIRSFILLLNKKIEEYSLLVDLPFNIVTVENKGKLEFTFSTRSKKEISFLNLSSGERTRVSLVTLLAIIATLESLTEIEFNYLVFDELLSVLDKQGVGIFKALLDTMKKNKALFVVIHHEEVDNDFFDGTVYLIKEKEITRMRDNGK